jgi:hypothetical protein
MVGRGGGEICRVEVTGLSVSHAGEVWTCVDAGADIGIGDRKLEEEARRGS